MSRCRAQTKRIHQLMHGVTNLMQVASGSDLQMVHQQCQLMFDQVMMHDDVLHLERHSTKYLQDIGIARSKLSDNTEARYD